MDAVKAQIPTPSRRDTRRLCQELNINFNLHFIGGESRSRETHVIRVFHELFFFFETGDVALAESVTKVDTVY